MQFALKQGKNVGIGEVERGLICDCICVACAGPLVAKKGIKNEHHFAHHKPMTEAQIFKCNESYNHWLLKHLFADLEYMALPAWNHEPGFTIHLNSSLARVEKSYQGFRADCVVFGVDGRELIIEVINWNGISDQKMQLIRSRKVDCITVNAFGWIHDDVKWIEIESIKDRLRDDASIKKWVYHLIGEENLKVKIQSKPNQLIAYDQIYIDLKKSLFQNTPPAIKEFLNIRPERSNGITRGQKFKFPGDDVVYEFDNFRKVNESKIIGYYDASGEYFERNGFHTSALIFV